MRTSSWKRIGVALPVVAALSSLGVLTAQAVAGGSGDDLPLSTGISVAAVRGLDTVANPTTADGPNLAANMNNWQETAALNQGQRGSRRRF